MATILMDLRPLPEPRGVPFAGARRPFAENGTRSRLLHGAKQRTEGRMRRALLVVSWMIVCGSLATGAQAQGRGAGAPGVDGDNNGWVVLPVDEYRALR